MNPENIGMDALFVHRRRALRTGLFVGASFAAWPAARACEFAARTLTIVHPWTRASVDGATEAVVCMSLRDVLEDERLMDVRTPVADRADMGPQSARAGVHLDIVRGSTVTLSESGTHVRLLGLRMPLAIGREYPMTLVFQQAGEVHTKLSVDYLRFR